MPLMLLPPRCGPVHPRAGMGGDLLPDLPGACSQHRRRPAGGLPCCR